MEIRQAQLADALKGNWARSYGALTTPAMIVKYIGSAASGTIEIAAVTGDVTFKHGALGAEAVDTTVVAITGIIDVSDAAMNTFGEVVDIINASANWSAKLLGVLRSDSSDNCLAVLAATQVKVTNGLVLLLDEAVALYYSITASEILRKGPENNAAGVIGVKGVNSDANVTHSVRGIICTNTFATGTNIIKIYDGETQVFSYNGGATTVEQTKTFTPDKISATRGKRLIVKMVGSVTAVGSINAFLESINFVNP